jgi:hypothetical protein
MPETETRYRECGGDSAHPIMNRHGSHLRIRRSALSAIGR